MKFIFGTMLSSLVLCYASYTFASESGTALQSARSLSQVLNLSPQQMKEIKKLQENANQSLRAIKWDVIGQDVIIKMIKSGEWDESEAKKQLQNISNVQAEARYQRAHYLFEVSKVLTPEQKIKLQEMMTANKGMY
ncbi:Spy/CpxP family protein refolding chaperone [Aeromonas jandaei]|uniref:Spy/CpxP family protein refolding chaperone n=1 Tax=Aeromonas jandaei TaxID=650 RepID=UPI003BA15C43